MALSQNVKDKLKEAEGVLREASYWAAKNESPATISAIARIIADINSVEKVDALHENLDNFFGRMGFNPGGEFFK